MDESGQGMKLDKVQHVQQFLFMAATDRDQFTGNFHLVSNYFFEMIEID
jgi:hypothetical protein